MFLASVHNYKAITRILKDVGEIFILLILFSTCVPGEREKEREK